MQVPAISPDIIIIVILILAGIYGLMGGKHRLRLLILSTYVGIVLAQQFASVVHPYATMLSADQVSWLLLGLPIILFGFSRHHKGAHTEHKGSSIANLLVGVLTGGLIIASALRVLAPSGLETVRDSSFIAYEIHLYDLWLLGLLPLVAVLLGLIKPKDKHH
jgi:NhaP-type Na+/H+ or K+/H+ antiporter